VKQVQNSSIQKIDITSIPITIAFNATKERLKF